MRFTGRLTNSKTHPLARNGSSPSIGTLSLGVIGDFLRGLFLSKLPCICTFYQLYLCVSLALADSRPVETVALSRRYMLR